MCLQRKVEVNYGTSKETVNSQIFSWGDRQCSSPAVAGGRRCWESETAPFNATPGSVLISTLSRTGSYPQDATGVALGV